jgi:phosphoribosylformimino-5-aminoimidazole carboxamide ribotide isomerase
MQIIPTIDILGGKVVRLRRGNFRDKIIYSSSPIEVALRWESENASRIHIIDLDAVYTSGEKRNIEIIEEIRNKLSPSVKLQVGGGIRSLDIIERLIDKGIDYLILGSVLFLKPKFFQDLKDMNKNRFLVALDVNIEGKLLSTGWQKEEDKSIEEFLSELIEEGINSFIYTDTYHDGTLLGFHNIGTILKIKEKFPNLNLYFSGGVNSISDLIFLERFSPKGVIIGRALYEGKLNLPKLIERFGKDFSTQ